jgi:hypothetical protein
LGRPPDLETRVAQVGNNPTGQGLNVSACVAIERHGNDALDLNLVYRLSHPTFPAMAEPDDTQAGLSEEDGRPMLRGRPTYRYPDPHSARIADIALSLGVKPSAISRWRSRHSVSHAWRLPIYREAWRRGVDLPDEVFDRFSVSEPNAAKKARKPRR